jgi:hypothetical protein
VSNPVSARHKGAHTRTSLASESGWARVPTSQTRPCVECHEPDFGRLYISEPGSRVKLPEADSRQTRTCMGTLRCRSAAARPLRLWVRIPAGAWKFVCCECCVLPGRGLYLGLITHPEESYRLGCVVVCEQKAREWGDPGPLGADAPKSN